MYFETLKTIRSFQFHLSFSSNVPLLHVMFQNCLVVFFLMDMTITFGGLIWQLYTNTGSSTRTRSPGGLGLYRRLLEDS